MQVYPFVDGALYQVYTAPGQVTEPASQRYRWTGFAVVLAAMIMNLLDSTIVNVAAPSIHHNAFPDATLNPPTGPIHTYHLGLWFNSPQDAVRAGCSGNTTPFNGEHDAGIQVLNTSNFPNLEGPLLRVKP